MTIGISELSYESTNYYMKMDEDNAIGIVGGMGPEASLALFNRILSRTAARKDQDHLSMILMSFPRHIADRTAFLEGMEPVNPAYSIARIIGKLAVAGSKIVGIACNTAHAPEIFNVILEELDKMNSRVKLVSMPLETCRHIRSQHSGVRRIGIMSTNGTYKAGIYENLLREWGYEVVLPDLAFQQDCIHRIVYDPVYGIKANANKISRQARSSMQASVEYFKKRKTDAIVLGCTELSLFATGKEKEPGLIMIDSIEALARALIREAVAGTQPVVNCLPTI